MYHWWPFTAEIKSLESMLIGVTEHYIWIKEPFFRHALFTERQNGGLVREPPDRNFHFV